LIIGQCVTMVSKPEWVAVTEFFPVVACDDQQSAVAQPEGVEFIEQRAHVLVGFIDSRVIERANVFAIGGVCRELSLSYARECRDLKRVTHGSAW
jgi:hypothetical protein